MKVLQVAIILTGCATVVRCQSQPDDEYVLTWSRDAEGTVTTTFAASKAVIDATPTWDGLTVDPPLSISKAARIAQEWLTKKNPDYADFRPVGISLRRLWTRPGQQWRWFYVFAFSPQTVSTEAREAALQPSFQVVMLMDGSIVEPRVGRKP
jgi:hypothetical protein